MRAPTRLRLLTPLLASLLLLGSGSDALAKKKKAAAPAARAALAPEVPYGARDDVMRFGAELAERQGLDVAEVQETLKQARFVPAVAKFIMPPPAGTATAAPSTRPAARWTPPARASAQTASPRSGPPPRHQTGSTNPLRSPAPAPSPSAPTLRKSLRETPSQYRPRPWPPIVNIDPYSSAQAPLSLSFIC